MPDYAALYLNRSIKPLPFPELVPQLTPFKTDPKTGYMIHDMIITTNNNYNYFDVHIREQMRY